jgi:TusA-related sulfurtransferase
VTGDVIVVLADDPAAANDIPAWCRLTGNEFISATPDTPGAAYAVRISAG